MARAASTCRIQDMRLIYPELVKDEFVRVLRLDIVGNEPLCRKVLQVESEIAAALQWIAAAKTWQSSLSGKSKPEISGS